MHLCCVEIEKELSIGQALLMDFENSMHDGWFYKSQLKVIQILLMTLSVFMFEFQHELQVHRLQRRKTF